MELLIQKPIKKHRKRSKNFYEWWTDIVKGNNITNDEVDNILNHR